MSFPVLGVNGLSQNMEFMEYIGFTDADHFILDPSQESIVGLSVKCSIFPLDACDEAVEHNQVFCNSLIVTYTEGFKVSLGFAYRVMRSKVVFQLRHELGVVIKPIWVNVGGKGRFE